MPTDELIQAHTGENQSTVPTETVIRVEGLEKTYGSGEDAVTAVDGVSLEIEPGTIVGLLGPNGAGKTTTIKSMLGLVVPDSGSVSICGVDVSEEPERAHSHVGAMLEGDRNVYWRLTVRENLEFFSGLGGQRPGMVRERHDELLERLDIADRADTPVNELSKGMKQKVSLASTLARDIDVIFLDEPTLGLDVETSRDLHAELRRLAEEEDITIVLTSHNLDIIEAVSDRVVILNDGQVIADDDTDALVELFRTQSYRLRLDAPVPEAVCAQLEREFDATCRRADDHVTVECVDADGETIYALMETLAETGQKLREIESVEPDLEEAFLRLIDRDDGSDGGGRAPDSDTVHGQSTAAMADHQRDGTDAASNADESREETVAETASRPAVSPTSGGEN